VNEALQFFKTWLEGSIDAGYGDPDWMLEDEDLTGPCSSGGPCCGSVDCD